MLKYEKLADLTEDVNVQTRAPTNADKVIVIAFISLLILYRIWFNLLHSIFYL